MKVILVKDVARLGRKSEVKEVPDGHALNFLIPRKLAIIATSESIKRLNEELEKQGEYKAELEKNFEKGLAGLEGKNVVYAAEANEKGSLFKGISAQDIAAHLSAQYFSVTKNNIVLPHPLKEVGIHEVGLTHGKVKGTFKLEVVKK